MVTQNGKNENIGQNQAQNTIHCHSCSNNSINGQQSLLYITATTAIMIALTLALALHLIFTVQVYPILSLMNVQYVSSFIAQVASA